MNEVCFTRWRTILEPPDRRAQEVYNMAVYPCGRYRVPTFRVTAAARLNGAFPERKRRGSTQLVTSRDGETSRTCRVIVIPRRGHFDARDSA